MLENEIYNLPVNIIPRIETEALEIPLAQVVSFAIQLLGS
jgi:hypothetical protein